jgi:hypothetical protein
MSNRYVYLNDCQWIFQCFIFFVFVPAITTQGITYVQPLISVVKGYIARFDIGASVDHHC